MIEPTFRSLLDEFETLHATVLGDLMLDRYVFGNVSRISPEAPVMVVRQTQDRSVPGGAANVAKNVVALGASVTVLGVTGSDAAGETLASELAELKAIQSVLIQDPSRITTQKTRIVADHSHQVLRIDREDDAPVSADTEAQLIASLEHELSGSHVLILSDYLKGVLTPEVAKRAIEIARTKGIVVVANPKPKSALQYRGASLVSLNRVETAGLLSRETISLDEAKAFAPEVCRILDSQSVSITLGEEGLVTASGEQVAHIPAPKVEVYDTAGAGDTVVAVVGLGMAAHGWSPGVFRLATEASARVVRHVGVAVPTAADLAELRSLPDA